MMKPKTCEGCPLYEKGHGFVVPKNLPKNPVLLVQGEAPGRKEVESGEPFVGDAGHWLRRNILDKAGISADSVIVDNTLRCLIHNESGAYPTEKEGKSEAEKHCRQYDIWQNYPTVPLMLVGNHAIQKGLGKGSIVSQVHGHIEVQGERIVGCTYHPAAVMYEPDLTMLVSMEFYNLMVANRNRAVLKRPYIHKGFVPVLRKADEEVVFDLEWNPASQKLTCVGVAFNGQEGYATYTTEQGVDALLQMRDSGVILVGHNILKADLRVLSWTSLNLKKIRDTLGEMHLVHPHMAQLGLYDLGSCVRMYLPRGEWKRDKSDLAGYCGMDAVYTNQLKDQLARDIKLTKQEHLVHEQKEIGMLAREMEERGCRLDREELYKYAKAKVEGKAEEKASFGFNPNSNPQVIKYAKSVGISIRNAQFETLKKHEGKDATFDKLIAYKEDNKSITTWFPVTVEDNKVTNVEEWMFPEWNPYGTRVDRWSSAGPNMQNLSQGGRRELPDGSVKMMANMRRFIVARDPDLELVSYDWGQIENRIVAFLAGDTAVIEAMKAGLDFHRFMAAEMFGVRYDEVTSTQRYQGKRTVHATDYFETANNLALRLNCSLAEAKRLQAMFFGKFHGMAGWKDTIINQFERGDNAFRNVFGRLRYIFANDSRNTQYGRQHERLKRAAHFLGCSPAARIINRGAINVRHTLGLIPLLIVHDELVYELPKGDTKIRSQIYELLHAPVLELDSMVIPVNMKVGSNYGNLH